MSEKRIVKQRVHVIGGAFKGHRGWGYSTEDQFLWDTISVRLDKTPPGLFKLVKEPLIRLKLMNIRLLSDLEALAEVGEE